MNHINRTANETKIRSIIFKNIKYDSEILLTAGSKPAMPAYARACGMTVKPTVTPATKSPIAS